MGIVKHMSVISDLEVPERERSGLESIIGIQVGSMVVSWKDECLINRLQLKRGSLKGTWQDTVQVLSDAGDLQPFWMGN